MHTGPGRAGARRRKRFDNHKSHLPSRKCPRPSQSRCSAARSCHVKWGGRESPKAPCRPVRPRGCELGANLLPRRRPVTVALSAGWFRHIKFSCRDGLAVARSADGFYEAKQPRFSLPPDQELEWTVGEHSGDALSMMGSRRGVDDDDDFWCCWWLTGDGKRRGGSGSRFREFLVTHSLILLHPAGQCPGGARHLRFDAERSRAQESGLGFVCCRSAWVAGHKEARGEGEGIALRRRWSYSPG